MGALELTAAELTAAGLTAAELTAAGLTAAELTAAELTAAGLTAAELTAAELTVAELDAKALSGGFVAETSDFDRALFAVDLDGRVLAGAEVGCAGCAVLDAASARAVGVADVS